MFYVKRHGMKWAVVNGTTGHSLSSHWSRSEALLACIMANTTYQYNHRNTVATNDAVWAGHR